MCDWEVAVWLTGMYGVTNVMMELPPTPPSSSSNCSSDSECCGAGSLSPERSAPPSPASSPYYTRAHLSTLHAGHSASSSYQHHASLWTSSQLPSPQALFASPVTATACRVY